MTEHYTAPNGRRFPIVRHAAPTALPKKPKKRSKYGNKPVTVDGERIDSKREADRWEKLCGWEQAGIIRDLVRQPKFILAPSVKIDGEARARPAMRYRADAGYVVVETGQRVVEDTKSAPTASETAFRMRQHLMKSAHNIDVKVVK